MVCGVCIAFHSLFALPLGVVGMPGSVILAISGHFLYYSAIYFLFTSSNLLPNVTTEHSYLRLSALADYA